MFSDLPEHARTVIQTVLMGLVAASTAVLFLLATHWGFALTFETYARYDDLTFVIASFLTILVSSLAVGLLLTWAGPMAEGSGIPQLKAAYWKETGAIPLKPVIIKFVCGVLSIGGGASLGREGPTLFFGGGAASGLSRLFKTPKSRRRIPAAVGASAGLAAAFNTPLAAITFVLEEILGDLSSRALGAMILASVTGAFVVFAFLGPQPAFSMPNITQISWVAYVILPAVALLTSLQGVAFQKATLRLRRQVRGWKQVPVWARPLFGGLITWLLGVTIYLTFHKLGVFGLGYQDLSDALNNRFLWWLAGIVIVAKWGATVASYAFGGCGGIFSPLLFLGGMGGLFLGGLAQALGVPASPSDLMALAAMGMATSLGSVLRTPLSCLLIVFEMTHEFSMVPGLMLGLLISELVSRLAGPQNFYDALLIQDGHVLNQVHPPQGLYSWKNVPVWDLATKAPLCLVLGAEGNWDQTVETSPYHWYPVVDQAGLPAGVLHRDKAQAPSAEQRKQAVIPATLARSDERLESIEARFLESPSGLILLCGEDGKLLGLITLHDLIRAQAALRD